MTLSKDREIVDDWQRRPGKGVSGIIPLLVGLVLVWQSCKIAGFSALSSPGAFPLAASAMMVVAALIVVIGDWRCPGTNKKESSGDATDGTASVLPMVVVVFMGMVVGYSALANIFMLVRPKISMKMFTKIVECPRGILIPLILLLSVVGAYAVNSSVTDVYWMLGFGVLGYFMKICGYQVGPLILGGILSRLIDENWQRAIISEQESLPACLVKMLSSPLSLVLFLGVVMILIGQTPLWPAMRRRFERQAA